MSYVYIVISELINDVNRALKDGFIVQGVYTDYDVAEKEMLTQFKNLCDMSFDDGIRSEIISGLECSKGTTKKARIYWKNGKITQLTIQERILDQITYESSVMKEP